MCVEGGGCANAHTIEGIWRPCQATRLGLAGHVKVLFVPTGLVTNQTASTMQEVDDLDGVRLLSTPELSRLFATFGLPFVAAVMDKKL